MKRIRAFNYYGSKVRAAGNYSPPRFRQIVEPFAGGAGYSLAHRTHDVVLIDLNADVIDAWRYLIATPAADILALPLLQPGESVPADLPRGARLIIGWSVMLCGASPQGNLVPAAARVPTSFWGESRRAALASLSCEIRHWQAFRLGYRDVPNTDDDATWFVDPPYFGRAGSHYPHGSDAIDYAHLATWCKTRRGQVIVCEGPDAKWLPFRASHDHAAAPTADIVGRRRSVEMVYEQ